MLNNRKNTLLTNEQSKKTIIKTIMRYIQCLHSYPELQWENELREQRQLASHLLCPETSAQLLTSIIKSERPELSIGFKCVKSRQDITKTRIIFDFDAADFDLTAAIKTIRRKLSTMADYLNVIHRPNPEVQWKINESHQLYYESESLTYTSGDGEDRKRANDIRKLLYSSVSDAASEQGLTIDFIINLTRSLLTVNGKLTTHYILQHHTFVWQNLFSLADKYERDLIAAETAFDVRKKMGFFMDPFSPHSYINNVVTERTPDRSHLETKPEEARHVFGKK